MRGDSALARWAVFLGALGAVLVFLETTFARATAAAAAPMNPHLHHDSLLPAELARIVYEEPATGHLRVFLHVPASGGRRLAEALADVVPTFDAGLTTEFTERDRALLAEACAWPTFDVFFHGHLSLNDVGAFGAEPCKGRTTRYVVIAREPVRRVSAWLRHEAPEWLYDEFKRGEASWSEFLRQEVENRLLYQTGGDAVYRRRDANVTRVMARAKSTLSAATVLYRDGMARWLAAAALCGERPLPDPEPPAKSLRLLDDGDARAVRKLTALDTDLFAWIRKRKPRSDPWVCFRGR